MAENEDQQHGLPGDDTQDQPRAALTRRDSNLQQSGDDEVDYGDEAIPDPEPRPPSRRDESRRSNKRKAEDGDQDTQTIDAWPVDPGATPAIRLSELHWWTTEEDLREICGKADVEGDLVEVAFGEHKINGKSKGEAYLEFHSEQAATAVKRAVDAASQGDGEKGVRKSPFVAHFTRIGNPYYTPPGGAAKNQESREGAYNTGSNNRGGFRGRGGRGRGGFDNSSRGGAQVGWGMNGGGFLGSGYGQNPMMAGFGNMGMGAFGGMGRGGGGMMNMMGGRGNFMNMGGNMMGGRGGGSWNNAGSAHGYNQNQSGGAGTKRMRTE